MSDEDKGSEELLAERGFKTFMGDVTFDSMKPIIDWIIAENFNKDTGIRKHKELTLAICSKGGDLNACFALVDVMKGSQIPIRTIGMGLIASCGLVLFISLSSDCLIFDSSTDFCRCFFITIFFHLVTHTIIPRIF